MKKRRPLSIRPWPPSIRSISKVPHPKCPVKAKSPN
ncbi:hypothetical protein WP1_080 [Pseudomonas phage WP1]